MTQLMLVETAATNGGDVMHNNIRPAIRIPNTFIHERHRLL